MIDVKHDHKHERQPAATPRRGRRLIIALASMLLLMSAPAFAQQGTPGGGVISQDKTPPNITPMAPAEGAAFRDTTTAVVFEARDPVPLASDLDVASVSFKLNGVELKDQLVLQRLDLPGAANSALPPRHLRATFTPTAAHPLPEGAIEAVFSIADRAGNRSTWTLRFRLDTQGPRIEPLAPMPHEPITNVVMPLTFRVVDDGVGVDPATLAVSIDGNPLAPTPPLSDGVLTISPPADGWPEGNFSVAIAVADRLANHSQAAFDYTVVLRVELAAYPRAIPSSGEAPLAVTFVPDVITSTAIERYQWDLDGNGSFERSETVGRNQTFTYTIPGTYDVKLRVTDSEGRTADGSVRVTVGNRPPTVTAEASPSNGAPPLAVTFSASASDSDGIARYEWDFEGDGAWDVSGTSSSATFVFANEGVFQPRVRVTDGRGATTEVAVPAIQIRVVAGAPSVTGSASPVSGNAPLTVNFNGSAIDPQGGTVAEWAWDFDGNGVYEHVAPSPAVSHVYTAPGTYYARVRATTTDGRSGFDIVEITVKLTLSLRVLTDTIDVGLGQTSAIETTLGGETEVSLVIENRFGAAVRTLVPWTRRVAGTHTDMWDGRGDAGAALRESDYRAILLYRIDGQMKRLDLGLTTGGVQSNPPRSGIPNRFSPLAGQPLLITYTLARASEVTAFMGRFNVNTRLVTFMQRQPQGRGTHSVVWNGENAEGQLFHPPAGDAFLFGIFAYTLPDNAIFVRSGVHASALSARPFIFDPTTRDDSDAPQQATIKFTLNRAGSVELTVNDAKTGVQVTRRIVSGLGTGIQSIYWDGLTDEGLVAAPGRYRIGVTGIDEAGARSTTVFAMQRIYY